MRRRYSPADLPEVVPVFPLPGALLLPRARLPLNIFEPRYLAMLDDTLRSDHRMIGMVQPREVRGQPPKLHEIGCVGRVTSITETDDGRYLIALTGIARFRIQSELEGFTPYGRVVADWTSFHGDLNADDAVAGFHRGEFLDLLSRYFTAAGLASDWDSLKEAEPEMLINSLAMMCPFSTEEKQALLESVDLEDRYQTLVQLMRFVVAAGGDDGESKVQ